MKLFSKKNTLLVLILALFLGLFLVNIGEAKAIAWIPLLIYAGITAGGIGALFKFGPEILESVLTQTVHLFAVVAHWFLGIMGTLFNNILALTSETLAQPVVYEGWTITRDIVNMFFILGLVVIAFATILRIETYGMKALLIKFIIIAILINFSYLACGIIIDAANIPTRYFAARLTTNDTAQTGVGGLMVASLTEPNAQNNAGATVAVLSGDPYELMLNELVEALIKFLAGFVILIGAILLVIRMAALWVLIILVPFAWFFSIFPKFKKLSDDWWSAFLKYAFFAPMFVFLVYLSIRIIQVLRITPAQTNMSEGFSYGLIGLTQFVVALIILGGAPLVATKMGIYGSQAVTGFAKGALKGALKGTYKLPGRLRKAMTTPPGWMKAIPGVRRVAAGLQKAAIWTTPAFWKTALKARKEEAAREAGVPEALGKMHDISNRVLSLFTRKTDYAEQAHQFEVDEEEKRMMLRTKGNSKAVITEMASTKNRNIRDAGFKILAKNNDYNELLQSEELGKPYNQTFSRENFVDLFYKMQAESGVSERKASAFLANLQEEGLRAGTNFYGAVGMDEKGWKRNSVDEMNRISTAKATTLDQRRWIQTVHPMSMIKLDVNNNYAGLDEGALKEYAKKWTPGIINSLDFSRARTDFIEKIGSVPKAVADIRKLAGTLTGRDKDSLEAFANRIENAATTGKTGAAPKPAGAPSP